MSRVDSWDMAHGYTLTTEDSGRVDHYGKTLVRYVFTVDGNPLFSGEDFACSPMHEWDSDESVGGLLSFLTLGKGDTDSEYFDGYTPEQLAFRDENPDREALALEAYLLENDGSDDN